MTTIVTWISYVITAMAVLGGLITLFGMARIPRHVDAHDACMFDDTLAEIAALPEKEDV